MDKEIIGKVNELMKTNGRLELNADEAEKVTGAYWLIDGLPTGKETEPGGASGGW